MIDALTFVSLWYKIDITGKVVFYMAVSSDKIRILVTVPRDEKEKLEEAAKRENRSVSNYVYTLIQKELNKKQV